MANTANVAAATQELVDTETRRLVHEAEDTAKQILEMNSQVLDELANALIEAETLAGPALEVFLEAVVPWPQPLVTGVNGNAPKVILHEAVVGEAHTQDFPDTEGSGQFGAE